MDICGRLRWSANENSLDCRSSRQVSAMMIWVFYRDYTYVYQDEKPKNYAYSVRCVKD